MTTEKIKLMEIYKQDGKLNCVVSPDLENPYELLGFLILNVEDMKDNLKSQFERTNDDGIDMLD